MSTSGKKTVTVECPWCDCGHRWQVSIPSIFENAQALPDELKGMLGENMNCPNCCRVLFIHHLKKGERPLPPPEKGHRPSPP